MIDNLISDQEKKIILKMICILKFMNFLIFLSFWIFFQICMTFSRFILNLFKFKNIFFIYVLMWQRAYMSTHGDI